MIKRILVKKKEGYNVSANKLTNDILNTLGIKIGGVDIYIRYDIEGITDAVYNSAKNTIFSEAPIDEVYEDAITPKGKLLIVEYLKGQYDQRADSAMQCVSLLAISEKPLIRCATLYDFVGISGAQFNTIKNFLINPVESKEGSIDIPKTLVNEANVIDKVEILYDFMKYTEIELERYHARVGFAMSLEDLQFVREYFVSENRVPTETEIKVIDTYWSDHCRHTTFNTELTNINVFSDNPHIKIALNDYDNLFKEFNGSRAHKYKCLMDIATITVKKLKKMGYLKNLDTSDEINACSVVVDVDNDGEIEEWLIMFKNETHNHPTEIEPFGGAATCLGGAIRDPLSGRTYVYQAMRVTGASDPNEKYEDTIKGKLPQRVITKTAAAGYSSYGNQIGLATGLVSEMYHSGYKAKRLETGFVISGAPRKNIYRNKPKTGDIIVLLGGETGRDGCGGATGSSKAHTEKSVEICGAEVQKGNALTERKLQRLFRDEKVSTMIIKCNDFGAGGICVAIGELADGLDIDLDKVTLKYDGLGGTELAISESQERMAVVLDEADVEQFIEYSRQENLIATRVAIVTKEARMRMFFNGQVIVDISREFLDTNGVKQCQKVNIEDNATNYTQQPNEKIVQALNNRFFAQAIFSEMERLNICSTKGLGEMFDGSIGASSVTMPWGGKYQLTQSQVMAAKPPVSKSTDTVTVCSYACYPSLNSCSPFTGAIYSIVASMSKLIASGVSVSTVRLTLQEYFKRLNKDATRWGEPTSAVLGAMYAQLGMKTAAIGGKDSMSGTFENIDVPPTLISFAVGIYKASKLITNVFTTKAKSAYLIKLPVDDYNIPKFDKVLMLYDKISKLIDNGTIVAANVVEEGGAVISTIKSCLGNKLGFKFGIFSTEWFNPIFGSFVVLSDDVSELKEFGAEFLGEISEDAYYTLGRDKIAVDDVIESFEGKLKKIFPITAEASGEVHNIDYRAKNIHICTKKIGVPKVLIPVFPGTNCEYDTARAFKRAGAETEILIIRNQNASDIEESVARLIKGIKSSQIIAFPGGFSGGDEPDGSGKFIATTFKNPLIADEVMELLNNRDGLAIGICNGFQALIKLGLVPYGDIREQIATAPTLTYNNINRHISNIVQIRVASNKSPWLASCNVGDIYNVAISHGEGRFVSSQAELDSLIASGSVATQYVDFSGNATMQSPFNPNGSMMSIEGIVSPDGRVLGKMGHSERIDDNLYKNIEGDYDMKIFESGVKYFK